MAILNMIGKIIKEIIVIKNWLCFTANTANSTVQLTKIGTPTDISLEISTDNINWSSYTIWDTITLSNIGDKVYFRNTSESDTGFSTSLSDYYKFVMTWSIAWSWDITTLLNKNWTNTVSSYCFSALFYECSSLATPPTLPATTLNTNCYRGMFLNCTSLSKAPELPATTLAESCYYRMFRGCSSLTICPELPATTLARECYSSMFRWCTWLTTPPALPATTLAIECYGYMFRLCTWLLTTPKLPATTLANSCYKYMFHWCTWLLSISKLPATAMASECYNSMFRDCTNIKLSTSQTWAYQTAYRIPPTWTWSESWTWYSLLDMFTSSWWTFTGTPTINTTYYTSNILI